MTDRLVPVRDGRRLGVTGLGDPVGERLVLLCHPAPGSGGFDPEPAVTSSWGVHVVSLDRPGYASSTALPDDVRPLIAHRADDVAEYVATTIELAKESGRAPVRRVGVIGWSAGGRIALAFAARHPAMVDRVAVVATPAPDSAVPWVDPSLKALNRELLGLPVPAAKARLRAVLGARPTTGAELLAAGPEDLAALEEPGLRGRVERMLGRASEQGTVGEVDDLLSYAGDDWGFDLDRVEAPVLLVYGARDTAVPSAHGRWYRRRLPHARLAVVARAGHLVVVPAWRTILGHVDPNHGSRAEV